MFGRTDLAVLNFAILLIAASGALTDLAFGKIFNWLTLPALALGIAASAWVGGWGGFFNAFLAIFVGFLIYGWIFYVGAMGAGDVKFLMALGAWGGVRFVVETAVLGVVVGGACAIGILIFQGQLKSFVERMRHFLLTVALKELELEKPKINHALTMPFGIPIAIAAAWVTLGHPFEQWGISLWSR